MKNSKFKKFLLIYILILIIVMILFLIYVADSLIKYEENQTTNYIDKVIDNLKNTEIDIQLSKFENDKKSAKEAITKKLNSSELTYKKDDESSDINPIYNVCINDEPFLKIKLKEEKKENRLGLLTFSKWKTEQLEIVNKKGLYSYEIQIPSNYEVLINGIKLGEEDITDENKNEGLTQISKYVNIPYIVKYEVTNLYIVPEVKVLDENKNDVQYEINGNVISKELKNEKVATEQELESKIKNKPDIMKIAEQWSLFLTDDLSGEKHGFNNISQYLIKDSDLYKYARSWATGIDITFVTSHTLENPTFTNKSISSIEIYSEDAFSAEVYLQKNLRLKTGKRIEDKMHERMYFANYKDENGNKSWKLVNMQSIVDNK